MLSVKAGWALGGVAAVRLLPGGCGEAAMRGMLMNTALDLGCGDYGSASGFWRLGRNPRQTRVRSKRWTGSFPGIILALGALAVWNYTPASAQDAGAIVGWGANVIVAPSELSGVVAVAAGARHSLGLKSDGSIVAWGNNRSEYGQYLGPCEISVPNTGFTGIAGGAYHSLGLKADGSIVAWGDNAMLQCQVPTPNSGFVGVAAGTYHSLGLKADGSIVAWRYSATANATSRCRTLVSSASRQAPTIAWA